MIVHVNTALTRRSTIASIAGPSEDDGAQSSKRWPSLAKTASYCRSTRPRLKLTGVPPAEKGGAQSSNRPLARRPHDKNPCAERSALPAGRPASDSRPGCRYRCGSRCPGARATHERAPRQGYDGDKLRGAIIRRGAKPVIPNKSNRVVIHRFNKRAYKGRNVIERCFCRLKDFRRIATRYDKLARNFLAAVHLAALVAYWLN
uniref:ID457 n=1 Tax=Bradyrhizobium japonicum TaxID=375 RepID=Q9AN85_BRAJP|nr:ID457 [Bradyrhizobium japonicum]